jgi:hypothetical protein
VREVFVAVAGLVELRGVAIVDVQEERHDMAVEGVTHEKHQQEREGMIA